MGAAGLGNRALPVSFRAGERRTGMLRSALVFRSIFQRAFEKEPLALRCCSLGTGVITRGVSCVGNRQATAPKFYQISRVVWRNAIQLTLLGSGRLWLKDFIVTGQKYILQCGEVERSKPHRYSSFFLKVHRQAHYLR